MAKRNIARNKAGRNIARTKGKNTRLAMVAAKGPHQNATRHGAYAKGFVLVGETHERLVRIRRAFEKDFETWTSVQFHLVDRLARLRLKMLCIDEWKRTAKPEDLPDIFSDLEVDAFLEDQFNKTLRRLRQENDMEALARLRRRQCAALPAPAPSPPDISADELSSTIAETPTEGPSEKPEAKESTPTDLRTELSRGTTKAGEPKQQPQDDDDDWNSPE
jgi:hypothetical protein